MKKIELLSPVGNLEMLNAAVNNGADAIYLAGKNYGARKYANNFTNDEIKEAIKYAIENGEPGDIIVLAGKGHEDYQEIKGVKYPMDERVLISEVLKELKEKNVRWYNNRYFTRTAW